MRAASLGRFDGVPHLTPVGNSLPVKVSFATVKILFPRLAGCRTGTAVLHLERVELVLFPRRCRARICYQTASSWSFIRAKRDFGFEKLSTSG